MGVSSINRDVNVKDQPDPDRGTSRISRLDSGDDRMQSTQFISGQIWGELDTAIVNGGDPLPWAGAAWFRVKPHVSGGSLSGAAVTGQGYEFPSWPSGATATES